MRWVKLRVVGLLAFGVLCKCALCANDADGFVREFATAYNSQDSNAVQRLAEPAEQKWIFEEMEQFRGKHVVVSQALDLVLIGVETNGAEIVATVNASRLVQGKAQGRKQKLLFYLRVVEGSLRLTRTRYPEGEEMNGEMRAASDLASALVRACSQQDMVSMGQIFGVATNEMASFVAGEVAVLRKYGADEVHSVVAKGLRVALGSVERSGADVVVVLRVSGNSEVLPEETTRLKLVAIRGERNAAAEHVLRGYRLPPKKNAVQDSSGR